MKIATFNIDWGKRHFNQIQRELNTREFDLLILTETVPLDLPAYNFIYASTALPQGKEYEGMNYSTFATGANRVAIYSKYPSIRQYNVSDEYTSTCQEFDTSIGPLTIYATIIGTWFNKKPFAEKELANCIRDCQEISRHSNSLCLTGDLNTSFIPGEKLQINEQTTKQLRDLCSACNLELTTAGLKNNIDHILLPLHLNATLNIVPSVFVEKGKLSDHQGVYVKIQHK